MAFHRFAALVGVLVMVFWCCCFSVNAGIEILVTSGEAPPDGNGTFDFFSAPPSLGNTGHSAFHALLAGTAGGTSDYIGAFRIDPVTNDSPIHVDQIARSGETLSGHTIQGFVTQAFYVDDEGFVNGTMLTGSGADLAEAAFRGDGTTLVDLVPRDSTSPSSGIDLFAMFQRTRSPIGEFVYRALYYEDNENFENGLYASSPDGVITTKIRYGDLAPGGEVINSVGGLIAVTKQSEIATFANLAIDETESFDALLRISPSNIVTEIVRDGELLGDGLTTINQIGGLSLMNSWAGALTFQAEYQQPGIIDQGLFLADEQGVRLIAGRTASQTMDVGREIRIVGLSDDNRAVFTSEVGILSTIQIASSGSSAIVAYEEMALPEMGVAIKHLFTDKTASNASGEIAFLANISEEIGGSTSGQALFQYSDQAGLTPIVQTGELFAGGTLAEIKFRGTHDTGGFGMPSPNVSGMNDSGQIAFAYLLESGDSGIAIWSPDIEPGDFTLDGDIDGDDFLAWQRDASLGSLADWQANYGNAPAQAGTIPEPSSVALTMVFLTLSSVGERWLKLN